MTAGARVRHAELHREIRPRDADAVIVARVDHHVGGGRHVAPDAIDAARPCRVEVMLRRLVRLARMAAETDLAPWCAELAAVRVVAVRARHATVEHLRLQKGAVLVDLVADLPVRVVEPILEQRDSMGVTERPAVAVVVGELAAARVTAPAQLDFARRLARRRPLRVARLRADRPRDGLALVERDGESLRPAVETSPVAFLLRPRDVARAGPMARLARDVDLGIGGGEPPRPGVVVFSHACRVALGAHVVPVLTGARPVQLVTVGHVLARVEMKPSLPALGARPRVPGDAERLEAAVGEFDEVLLERRCSERIRDVVVVQHAVGAIGSHHELPVTPEERRRHAGVREARVVEVAGDAGVCRRLHGEIVMRSPPVLLGLLVTLPARRVPHVTCRRARRRKAAGPGHAHPAARLQPPGARRDRQRGESHGGTERNRSRDTPRPGNRLCRSIGCGPPSLPLASAHVPYWPSCVPTRRQRDYSNAKIRFQSFFMLMTTQLCFFAWAIKASGKVPTLDVGP